MHSAVMLQATARAAFSVSFLCRSEAPQDSVRETLLQKNRLLLAMPHLNDGEPRRIRDRLEKVLGWLVAQPGKHGELLPDGTHNGEHSNPAVFEFCPAELGEVTLFEYHGGKKKVTE